MGAIFPRDGAPRDRKEYDNLKVKKGGRLRLCVNDGPNGDVSFNVSDNAELSVRFLFIHRIGTTASGFSADIASKGGKVHRKPAEAIAFEERRTMTQEELDGMLAIQHDTPVSMGCIQTPVNEGKPTWWNGPDGKETLAIQAAAGFTEEEVLTLDDPQTLNDVKSKLGVKLDSLSDDEQHANVTTGKVISHTFNADGSESVSMEFPDECSVTITPEQWARQVNDDGTHVAKDLSTQAKEHIGEAMEHFGDMIESVTVTETKSERRKRRKEQKVRTDQPKEKDPPHMPLDDLGDK